MPALTWRLANVAVNTFGELIEVDQTAANTSTGWLVAKTAAANDSNMVWGTGNTGGFSLESGTPKPSAAPASGNAFRSLVPYAGIFDPAPWTMTFAVRATLASSQAGRVRVRVYKSRNADGSGATELTGSTQVGTTSSALSTSADVTSVVTWTPSSTIRLDNEYIFITAAWEITTASGSNSGDVLFRTGTNVQGTRIVTSVFQPDFIPPKPLLAKLGIKGRSKPGILLPAPQVLNPATNVIDYVDSAVITSVTNVITYPLPSPPFFINVVAQFTVPDQTGLGAPWVTRNGYVDWNIFNHTASGATTQNTLDVYQLSNYLLTDGTAFVTAAIGIISVIEVLARVTGSISSNNLNGYSVRYEAAGQIFKISKITGSGSYTTLASVAGPSSFVTGNKLAIRIYGNTIEAWYYDGVSWSPVLSTTDSTFTAPGYFGMAADAVGVGNSIFLDDFGIETISNADVASYVDSATVASITTPATLSAGTWNNPVSDNFNRDENPLAPPWVGRSSWDTLSSFVSDGTVRSTNATIACIDIYQKDILTDCDASIGLTDATDLNSFGVVGRAQGSTNSDPLSGYLVSGVPGTNNVFIDRYDSNVATNLATLSSGFTLSANDLVGIRCYGSTIEAWVKHSGTWFYIGRATDSTYSSGYSGVYLNPAGTSAGKLDNFSTGPILIEQYISGPTVPVPTQRPLLVKLGRVGRPRLLTPDLPDIPGVAVNYTDSATISSVTSVQSSENTDFLDTSGAVQGTSSITTTETSQYIESATVSSVTSLTSTELFVPFVQAASMQPLLFTLQRDISLRLPIPQPVAVPRYDYVDSATITSITSVTPIVEVAAYNESGRYDILLSQLASSPPASGLTDPAVRYAQSITMTQDSILERIGVLMTKLSSPTDNVIFEIQSDASGSPSGTVLSTWTIPATSFPAFPTQSVILQSLSQILALSSGVTYWLVLYRSGAVDGTNAVAIAQNADNKYGTFKFTTNSGSSWSNLGAFGLYFDVYFDDPLYHPRTNTTVISTETSDYVETATITSITSLTFDEQFPVPVPYERPLLFTLSRKLGLLHNNILNPFSVSVGISYTDSATISSVTSIQSSESTDFLDTSGTVQGTSSVTSTEISQYIEAATIAGTTSLTYTETTDYVETATITSITSLTFDEQFPTPPAYQRPLLFGLSRKLGLLHNNILNPADSVRVTYIDSATVSGVTSVQAADTADFIDTSGTVNGVSTVSTTETTDYVETATVSSVTSITSVDVQATVTVAPQPLLIGFEHGRRLLGNLILNPADSVRVSYVDSATISSTTSITTTETSDFVDPNTGAITTTVTSLETTDFVESATVASVTSISAGEQYIPAGAVAYVPQPLLIKLGYKPTLHNNRLTFDDSVRVNYVDSATVSTVTSVASSDTGQLVDTGGTISGSTTLTYAESTDYVETATITTITSLTYVELYPTPPAVPQVLLFKLGLGRGHLKALNYTIAPVTPPAQNYIDAATITSTTAITSTDTADYVEVSTTSCKTSITYTEGPGYFETSTPSSTTTLFSTETAQYVDGTNPTTITYVSATEIYTTNLTDSATVTSHTTVFSTEYFKVVLTELYVKGVRQRWSINATSTRWEIGGLVQKWNIVDKAARWAVQGSKRRWKAWIR